jgi:hypothetical protein
VNEPIPLSEVDPTFAPPFCECGHNAESHAVGLDPHTHHPSFNWCRWEFCSCEQYAGPDIEPLEPVKIEYGPWHPYPQGTPWRLRDRLIRTIGYHCWDCAFHSAPP